MYLPNQMYLPQGTVDGVDLQALRQVVVFLNGQQSVDASLVSTYCMFYYHLCNSKCFEKLFYEVCA